jgi:hypothetical protein
MMGGRGAGVRGGRKEKEKRSVSSKDDKIDS